MGCFPKALDSYDNSIGRPSVVKMNTYLKRIQGNMISALSSADPTANKVAKTNSMKMRTQHTRVRTHKMLTGSGSWAEMGNVRVIFKIAK